MLRRLVPLSCVLVWSLPLLAQPTPPAPPAGAGEPAPPAGAPPEPTPGPETKPGSATPDADADPDADAPSPEQLGDPDAEPEESDDPEEVVPTDPDDVDPEDELPPVVPYADDERSGHVLLAVGGGLAVPFGTLNDHSSVGNRLALGPGLLAMGEYGLTRSVTLGLWFDAAFPTASSECADCAGTSLAGGVLVGYHFVQGVRFDPWVSAGLGFRTTQIESGATKNDYSGPVLSTRLGGDIYPHTSVGFGPYLGLDLGLMTSSSDADFSQNALTWMFTTGLRLTFDIPGKLAPKLD